MKNCLCVISIVLPAIFASSLSAEDKLPSQAPALNIPEVALQGTLLPVHVKQIESRLKYFTAVLLRAGDGDNAAISKARDELVQTFNYSTSVSYHYTVAQLAAKIVTPVLDSPSRIKQINAALALSKMPQVTIQPALEKMVRHSNSAVRYIGWDGYNSAWRMILAQGSVPAKRMFSILSERCGKEKSPLVTGAMWRMLRLRSRVEVGSSDSMGDLRKQGLAIFRKSWFRACRRVLRGDVKTMGVACKGISTALEYVSNAKSNKKKKVARAAMQLVANMMWCAGKTYKRSHAKGNVRTARAAEILLRDCEKALNKFLGLGPISRKNYIRFSLSDTTVIKKPMRGMAVMYFIHPRTGRKYGVLAWVDEMKKRFGITTAIKEMFQSKPPVGKKVKKVVKGK